MTSLTYNKFIKTNKYIYKLNKLLMTFLQVNLKYIQAIENKQNYI